MKIYGIFLASILVHVSNVLIGCASNVQSLKTLALKEYVRSTMWMSELAMLKNLPICLYEDIIRERSNHKHIGGVDSSRLIISSRWITADQSSHNNIYMIQPWYEIFAPFDSQDTMEVDIASWRCSIIIRLKEAFEHKKPFHSEDVLLMRANIEELFNEFPHDKALMLKRLEELQGYAIMKDEPFKGAKRREMSIAVAR